MTVSVQCPVALPHGAVGWSAVCDCGISGSYSNAFLKINLYDFLGFTMKYVKEYPNRYTLPCKDLVSQIYLSHPLPTAASVVVYTLFCCGSPGLQIYGGPGSLSHDFKIWPITFQGSGHSGPILFSCEKKSHFSTNIHLTARKQKVHVGCQYSEHMFSSHSKKKTKIKILKTNGSLM